MSHFFFINSYRIDFNLCIVLLSASRSIGQGIKLVQHAKNADSES